MRDGRSSSTAGNQGAPGRVGWWDNAVGLLPFLYERGDVALCMVLQVAPPLLESDAMRKADIL
ncbi:hypothetical protein [Acetobacter indonesiensis]|uniref:Uncharacterized protein n=1 Tax=Acetobacter indonesiensis TaxID=104101 RepID=A0A252AUI6_9PROT|nr:hypothetical protein [Acetobacter indonesiensis]OUI93966.1 hypothetical protein HK17_06740 [Acetobacter indonesiensis]